MAATLRAIGEGKLWLLLTSGLVADTPWLPSLIGFAVVLAVALAVLPARQLIAAAGVGQVASTLVVYGALGLTRLVDAHAFAPAVDLPDFGVSATIAAWIGALAAVAWARHDHRLVVAGCFACLGVGLAFRPTLTFLDAEHLVAFAIGVTVVHPGYQRVSVPVRRLVAVTVGTLHS